MADPAPPIRRVLVIEDEDNIALALEYVILGEGLVYDRVANGAEALPRIRQTHPDLVLLDVMLPEVSGYAICQSVRKDPDLTRTRIIMMTARGSATQRGKCLDAGADGFISKPFELRALRDELHRHLAQ
ncbi:MAG: hypothetical protein RIT14_160 [Pseudomonadota bacterium]|jgi:DNA-binding response OmpR family regulator